MECQKLTTIFQELMTLKPDFAIYRSNLT